ncbi:hypothetical protein [Sulfuriflexus sp.]|uniref:hypothetical protein n=1 Tax=Sulfuriflexus sp. TaxID=2015443 RepID=UPI00391EE752
MFLLGSGILVHGWPLLHHVLKGLTHGKGTVLVILMPCLAYSLACAPQEWLACSSFPSYWW